MRTEAIVFRGGGEMASAAARLLFLAGFPVVVLERAQPLAVRRLVSFAEAVRAGEGQVEGVWARRLEVDDAVRLVRAHDRRRRFVPVVVDEDASGLARFEPAVVVDGRMRKAPWPPLGGAFLRVGLGPGFVAGEDVDVVVETQRGPELGRVIWAGGAQADTAVPAAVLGHTVDRVLRASAAGAFHPSSGIGDVVDAGQAVGEAGGAAVTSAIGGLVRGLLADGVVVAAGEKVGDVDPRGRAIDAAAISEKARTVAAGVLEAVLVGLERRQA